MNKCVNCGTPTDPDTGATVCSRACELNLAKSFNIPVTVTRTWTWGQAIQTLPKDPDAITVALSKGERVTWDETYGTTWHDCGCTQWFNCPGCLEDNSE